jgi:hypothetical protein
VPASEFKLLSSAGEKAALEILKGHYNSGAADPDRAEYFVPVDWLEAVSLEQAVQEVGMFGNQNTVCKPKTPKWRFTVDRLKQKFPNYDK